jgi:hypothetical protein
LVYFAGIEPHMRYAAENGRFNSRSQPHIAGGKVNA